MKFQVPFLCIASSCLLGDTFAERPLSTEGGVSVRATGGFQTARRHIPESQVEASSLSETAEPEKPIPSKTAESLAQVRDCASLNSFIVSANMEFVALTGAHLMAMMVNALQSSGFGFPNLDNQDNLDAPGNWEKVRAKVKAMNIDVLVFACQECNYQDKSVTLLASEARLGTEFRKSKETSRTTMTKLFKPSKMFIGVLIANDDRCAIHDSDVSTTSAFWMNKGAVMIYLRAGGINIAYVGTHLDAATPEQRTANINMINAKLAKGHGGGNTKHAFSHVYIFGDLNYRLGASPLGDVERHVNKMISGHVTAPNAMYNRLKQFDTLEKSREVWDSAGYIIPGYTANVPATYKKAYNKGAAKIWYEFQTAVEKGSSLDPGSTIATSETLLKLMEGAYNYVPGLKKCEFEEGCVDFGWLDRLIYSGLTDVKQYRTLKMHPNLPIGDHSPLFMLLQSSR